MPRAHRHYLPGHVWHITHRCHDQTFLLKFKHDRRLWERWLYEARRRYGLRILNYIATSNHVHLLVHDRGDDEIRRSIQLVAGRTAQHFNGRRRRRGAFWEGRYHATAVETGEHLRRCLVYIDLNMVRAGRVQHPREWDTCGYKEIQLPRTRHRIINTGALMNVLGISDLGVLRRSHRDWVEEALDSGDHGRDPAWTEALAVGSRDFVEQFRDAQGPIARNRPIETAGETCHLREEPFIYQPYSATENDPVSG